MSDAASTIKSQLAIAWERWLLTERGKRCADAGLLQAPHMANYLKNRLFWAFMAGAEASRADLKVALAAPKPKPVPMKPRQPAVTTVRMRVLEAAQKLDAAVFYYGALKAKCFELFPAEIEKINAGIYPAVHTLLEKHQLHRVPGGFSLQSLANQSTGINS